MIVCSGVFDGLHSGHTLYLTAASRLRPKGELLMVAVEPDAQVVATRGRAPLWSEVDRALAVSAIGCVDGVTVSTLEDYLTQEGTRISLVVKGEDWLGRLPSAVTSRCRQLRIPLAFTFTERLHTSDARRSE